MTLPELATLVTVISGLVGIVILVLRYGPERRGILIKEEEGSFNILNSLTSTLQNEVTRLNAVVEVQRVRIAALEDENLTLRARAGLRRGDKDATTETNGP